MRIGYVLSSFPELSQTFVLNEMVELIKEGHEVYIVSLRHPKSKIMHKQVLKYNLLKCAYYPSRRYFNIALNLCKIKTLKYLKFRGKKFSYKLLAIAFANDIYKRTKKLNLDVIHTHFFGFSTLVSMILADQLKIPFTFTAHAYGIFINPDKEALRERINNAKYCITISDFHVKHIKKLTKTNKNKIKKIHANAPFYDLPKIKAKTKENRIISVARLVEKKGLIYALQAIKELKKTNPKIEYLIVGDGPLKSEFKNYIKKNDLEKNIKLMGALPNKKVIELISSASIFILPCVRAKNGDMDGIPTTLMEAMYLKKPVVSTYLSGIPELITNNKDGLLVDPKNVNQLVNAIKKLLKNKNLRVKLGSNAYNKVKRDFNIKKEIKKLINLWKK